jgi:predicted kinase
MAGLPGSGKSTIARRLAKEVGGVVLDKDAIRASLFPAELIEYSQEQDDWCMEVLLRKARELAKTKAVPFIFVDGRPFVLRAQLERVAQTAKDLGCGMKIIHTVCSDEAARHRLDEPHVAANRSFGLHVDLKAKFEPITADHLVVDTERPLEECVRRCNAYLLESGPLVNRDISKKP